MMANESNKMEIESTNTNTREWMVKKKTFENNSHNVQSLQRTEECSRVREREGERQKINVRKKKWAVRGMAIYRKNRSVIVTWKRTWFSFGHYMKDERKCFGIGAGGDFAVCHVYASFSSFLHSCSLSPHCAHFIHECTSPYTLRYNLQPFLAFISSRSLALSFFF